MKPHYRILLLTLFTVTIVAACATPKTEYTEPPVPPESLVSEAQSEQPEQLAGELMPSLNQTAQVDEQGEVAEVQPAQPEQLLDGFVPGWNQTTQVDEQGKVAVEVTPLNWNAQDSTLEFEISLDTHSVDLSMDLVKLSTLTTDTGIEVDATNWDAPLGGHHVSGKLIFPSTVDGMFILDGATKITIQLRDVDAPLRIFEWGLE